jgi:ABC-2 type transport system ATP-binding protein
MATRTPTRKPRKPPVKTKERDNVLKVENLVKVYPGPGNSPDIRAVDGIDLMVERGEIFGLLGPNGAGKTTTVGVCTTRVYPTSGRIEVDGIDVRKDPARVKLGIGVVTQFNTLDRLCTAWENIYFHCRYFEMSHREAKARADELLTQFRLSERGRSFPDELSGGMAQRLQVARSIAHRPSVLFLDEPTAGLDPQSRIALWEIVTDMRSHGITVLLTTHYMEEADQLCDRVAIIDHGKILVCDKPGNLKKRLGAETVILLHLDETPGSLAGRIKRLAGVVSVDPSSDGLRVLAKGGAAVLPKLVSAATRYGLRDVSVTEPTLETVFISLTGRELRE